MQSFKKQVKKHANLILFTVIVLLSGILAETFPAPDTSERLENTAECISFIERADSSLLSLSARSAVLIECESGNIIFGKNENARMPMASTTKIMTALVVLEECNLSDEIKIPKEAVGTEGSSVYLREGEVFSVRELLSALMLASANDAAVALALHTSGSIEAFAEKMNERAKSLGLKDTHFENPHGLDSDAHFTTAKELALIAREASENPIFRDITSKKKLIIRKESKESARLLLNHNKMLSRYEGTFGIKTGFTKTSGRCLVTGAERDGLALIAVTLSAPEDWLDHEKMLDFGFENYRREILCKSGELLVPIPVCGSYQTTVECRNREELSVVLPKDTGKVFEKRIEVPRFLFAPVKSGDEVGRVIYSIDGKDIASVPVYAAYSAAKRKN